MDYDRVTEVSGTGYARRQGSVGESEPWPAGASVEVESSWTVTPDGEWVCNWWRVVDDDAAGSKDS